MSRGPGNAQGYYRGDTFYYRVRCTATVRRGGAQVEVACGWKGYRAWPTGSSCPHCGGAVT